MPSLALNDRRLGRGALALLLVTVPGCAASRYAGISLEPGAADPLVQYLAWSAKGGDKRAQLELGIAFEQGRGVPRDCKRAKQLYRLAATATGGTIFTYQPPVGKGGRGMVVPINMGPRVAGLPEAKERLNSLDPGSSQCTGTGPAASISNKD